MFICCNDMKPCFTFQRTTVHFFLVCKQIRWWLTEKTVWLYSSSPCVSFLNVCQRVHLHLLKLLHIINHD